MSYFRNVRRTGVVVAICSSLFGALLCADPAFAMIMRPQVEGSASASPQLHPAVIHAVVAGGMAGWQVALIAVGSALFSAAAVVLIDHSRAGRRRHAMSAA
jgi:hypothetical protein